MISTPEAANFLRLFKGVQFPEVEDQEVFIPGRTSAY